jgi:hypothetical protein
VIIWRPTVFCNPVIYLPIHSRAFSRIVLFPTNNGPVGTIIQKGGEKRAPRTPPAADEVREFEVYVGFLNKTARR